MFLDPRLLRQRLEETECQIRDWTRAFTGAVDDSAALIYIVGNAWRALNREVRRQQGVVSELAGAAGSMASHAAHCATEASNALAEAGHAEAEARAAVQRASSAHSGWLGKLAQAQAEHSSALAELSEAQNELRAAELQLANAQQRETRCRNDVARAEQAAHQAATAASQAGNALAHCRNSYVTNEQGKRVSPDCSAHEGAYRAALEEQARAEAWLREARNHLDSAIQAVNAAQAHVNNARARVERAQNRVERARRRVDLTQMKVTLLGQLVARANDLAAQTAAGLRLAQTAAATARDAGIVVAHAQTAASEAAGHVQEASVSEDATRSHVEMLELHSSRFALQANEQLRGGNAAVQHLRDKAQELMEYDRAQGLGG